MTRKPVTDATKAKLPKPRTRSLKPAPPIPCMDWPADNLPSGQAGYIPPNAEPYPWPVRVLNWLDDAQFWTRQRVVNALRRMAARIAP